MGNIVYASFIFGFICALIKPDRVYRVTQRDFVDTRHSFSFELHYALVVALNTGD